MRRHLIGLALLLAGVGLGRAQTVSVPWAEFRRLYRESVAREIKATLDPIATLLLPEEPKTAN